MDEVACKSSELPDDPAALKALLREKELRIAKLEEELRLLIHKRFGASSEKADPDQLPLFNEAEGLVGTSEADEASAPEATDEITVPEHTRKKARRRPLPAELERVRIVHDVAEAEKSCPCGGGKMRRPIGEVVTEQIDIVPASIRVLQHVRLKYGPCADCDGVFPEVCTCGHAEHADDAASITSGNDGHGLTADTPAPGPAATPQPPAAEPRAVIVAPMPPQPIPKSNASPGTAAYIATAKFEDGLPLYRQEKMLSRIGVDISRGTLAAWMIRLGAHSSEGDHAFQCMATT